MVCESDYYSPSSLSPTSDCTWFLLFTPASPPPLLDSVSFHSYINRSLLIDSFSLSPLFDFSGANCDHPLARVESTPPIKRRTLDRGIIVAKAVNIVTNLLDIVLTSPYKNLFDSKQIYVSEIGTSDKEEA